MTDHPTPPPVSERGLVLPALIGLIVLYMLFMVGGGAAWLKPLEQAHAADVKEQKAHDSAGPVVPIAKAEKETPAEKAEHPEHHPVVLAPPPVWMVLPFAILLGCIAILPLMHSMEHWWEQNRNKLLVAGGLAGITLIYYLMLHAAPVAKHFLAAHGATAPPAAGGLNLGITSAILQNSMLADYIPFIVLLFSLYTIAGGIRIEGDLKAHPETNVAIMAIGAVIASIVGTTGAAMLLIRLLLETNSERKHVKHTVVFFIFIVCNSGGLLLPLGDPPLFLGYLRGVPFFWTLNLALSWFFVNGVLLSVYFLWDKFFAYPAETAEDIKHDETETRPLKIAGAINAVFLLGVILSVILLDYSKPMIGTTWIPWVYLREIAQLAMVACSLALSPAGVRTANGFNYGAIQEVACLFIGIFICMQPPLQILNAEGKNLGLKTETHFFWATGSLSAVLDNAPTYAVFMETAKTVGADAQVHKVAEVPDTLLAAVSLGAVLMGAMTYIGNGPNFMVKAIAEKSGVKMPSFFGYMGYSFGVLFPTFVLLNLLLATFNLWVLRM